MTLCATWLTKDTNSGEKMIAVSDRRVTGGGTIDFVPKIFTYPSSNSLICWEGDHALTFPFLENITLFIEQNPRYIAGHIRPALLLEELMVLLNRIWSKSDIQIQHIDGQASFLFASYDYEVKGVFQRLIFLNKKTNKWEIKAIERKNTAILEVAWIGDGSSEFEALIGRKQMTPTTIYEALKSIVDNKEVGSVGGIPQVVRLDRRGIERFGIRVGDHKYINGIKVDSVELISKKIVFLDYDNLTLGYL